jgi:DNA primase
VVEVVLFLDNDRGGRRAEALAREAFAHLSLVARYPRLSGADWNDVLRARRVANT